MQDVNFRLETRVAGYYKEVITQFDKDLFEALSPSLAKMEVVEFTGSKKGDHVHLRFLKPFRAEWISEIVDHRVDEERAYFIDEGVKMPFGLTYWRHRHIVEKIDREQSLIIDDIHFRGKNRLHTLLLYPVLYFGFYPRKNIYRRYFGEAPKAN